MVKRAINMTRRASSGGGISISGPAHVPHVLMSSIRMTSEEALNGKC
jgi:hypothetical protein